jgi:hypothetical protein
LNSHKINTYNKFKIPQEVVILNFYVSTGKIVGLGNDKSIKVWDIGTFNLLKSTIVQAAYGSFVCMDLSKEGKYLLIGTS